MASSTSQHRVLVYGGAGALGRAIVSTFAKAGSSVDNVDFVVNQEATKNHVLEGTFEDSLKALVKSLKEEGGALFDVVVCAAGGWAGGSLKSDTEALLSSVGKMTSMNTQSALAASHLAALFLKPSGLVVLTGANAARSGTSGMIGYGISKAATHQLAQSLAQELASQHSSVLSILPITLDTPSNRSSMPNADTSSWTPPSTVAETIKSWSDEKESSKRPKSGSLFLIETKDNHTTWSTVTTQY